MACLELFCAGEMNMRYSLKLTPLILGVIFCISALAPQALSAEESIQEKSYEYRFNDGVIIKVHLTE